MIVLMCLFVVFMALWAVALLPAGGPLSLGGRWFAWISVLILALILLHPFGTLR